MPQKANRVFVQIRKEDILAGSTQLGRIFGIPIRVHISLWIILPFFALRMSDGLGQWALLWGLLIVVGLFTSVALHELGHSLVAINKGCRVREILLLPIGGMARLENMPSKPIDEVLIAAAGPLVSFMLAFVFYIFMHLTLLMRIHPLAFVFINLAYINLVLAIFNLLPSFPMDGGRIFRAFMTPRVGRLEATRRAAKTGRVMAVIGGLAGIFVWPSFSLVAIAIFIYIAAGSEYRMVASQEQGNTAGGQWRNDPSTSRTGQAVSPLEITL